MPADKTGRFKTKGKNYALIITESVPFNWLKSKNLSDQKILVDLFESLFKPECRLCQVCLRRFNYLEYPQLPH